ncbi:type II toxin-antitoxin system RelE/ParE family toxin [Pedobacter sp. MC2016-14]|uniref:type II toxin-antitoxin system RelE/ParE family toxin n=1 Tax=Pedobacter sp. MC2016-14 TaxID=2897327 RepID=UPI001E640D23|nr:type II toxin-antitoxin system RelE/ParE family toxin [Pedobacter sp. MC2016-14]MCD0487666.1 type II toxin-antitoxin system RelE/ParE family toxin [Pedobacter sp. MC2016-14]
MYYRVIIASLAKDELQNSYDWYEKQKFGLGERFLLVIEQAISSISNNPEFYPVKVNAYRQYVVSKFPYVLVYELLPKDNLIYILHIFNTNQEPEKKIKI